MRPRRPARLTDITYHVPLRNTRPRLSQNHAVDATFVDELGSDYFAGAHRLAIELAHFVDHREAIARVQIVIEVDVPREHVDQLHAYRIGQTDIIGCGK